MSIRDRMFWEALIAKDEAEKDPARRRFDAYVEACEARGISELSSVTYVLKGDILPFRNGCDANFLDSESS
jgi:hypothetical protein